ncbi:hypothetical protein AVEN_173545-1 [Araneus ventricosus]|uniref:Uncharacterized protein n=1 Tax=Araneus ventricosus TaxID=182803 RepID=A0A4Y2Q216_ARAVE|nr:hypothetical protein AVEN_173545-1 [Araneus ventricosus]
MPSISRTASRQGSGHTSQSTVNFLEKIGQEMCIKTVLFTDIPAKSPDASSMDFCAFELFRRTLCKRQPATLCGLWMFRILEVLWHKSH